MNTCPWCTCWLHFLQLQASGLREKAEILEDERVEKTAAPGGAGEKSKHPPSAVYCGCHRWKLRSAEEKLANEEEAARFPRIKTLRANFTLPADGFYFFKFSLFFCSCEEKRLKMSLMDLEKLKMTCAGRAMAVLTSGGDAQGDLTIRTYMCGCKPVFVWWENVARSWAEVTAAGSQLGIAAG